MAIPAAAGGWGAGDGRVDVGRAGRVGALPAGRAGGRGVARGRHAVGVAVGRAAVRPAGRCAPRLSAAPRSRPPHPPAPGERAREHRRLEARGLHRRARDLVGRVVARRAGAGPVRGGRPVHRPHGGAPVFLFRHRAGRPCVDGRAGLPALVRLRGRRRRARGRSGGVRGDLSGDGGAAILKPGRKPALSPVGRRRDRHDRAARGAARAGGGAALRAPRHGDGLRLLAGGGGVRGGGAGDRADDRQRGRRARHAERVRARAAAGARTVAARHGARQRADHGAGRARPGAAGQAGRGGGGRVLG